MNLKEFSKKGGESKSLAKTKSARKNWEKALAAIKLRRDALCAEELKTKGKTKLAAENAQGGRVQPQAILTEDGATKSGGGRYKKKGTPKKYAQATELEKESREGA